MLRQLWRWSVLRHFLFAFLAWNVLDIIVIHRRLDAESQKYQAQGKLRKPVRVYIASLHWNNERILRESWNQGVLDLATAIGPKNVFVSVFESGSRDNSKAALRELDKALHVLGVGRNIMLDKTTHADEIRAPPATPGNGWVKTSRDRIELRRIPYLARLRNKSLQPFIEMAQSGITFDYILFLNDVVFSVCSSSNFPTLAYWHA